MTARPFSSVLVANRGEIARRVFRTARAMGLRCIAVYANADAAAPFVAEADEAVRVTGGYLDGEAIIAAALATGAEAIHPGYGYLSENADFAEAVIAAGLVWVGPPPHAVAAMGDKLAAKRAAVDAGVPTLPSSDDPADATSVGFPVLVKAAAGGGGKGMRVVDSAAGLPDAVASARREAAGAFGDDRVFLERYVPRARHIEIQLLGDTAGNLVHLGERECSIQRRHQKIVEEAPSPIVDTVMRDAIGDAALRLGKAIGYYSAGTVEFLVDDATREFFFLEVNTRLQVEHPVTEAVTGFDLVREQLRIAMGEPLGFSQSDVHVGGAAIEVRLDAVEPAATPAVRWESGVETGSVVGVDFDPMLAKVIAHAPSRTEAATRLALALERLHLAGLTTNRDFLVSTLRHPSFLAGDTTTDFIERLSPASVLELTDGEVERVATLGALWLQGRNRAEAKVLAAVASGWRNARLPAQQTTFTVAGRTVDIRYASRRDGTFAVGDTIVRVHGWTPSSIDAEVGGRRTSARVTLAGSRLFVQAVRGTVALDILPRFVVPGASTLAGGFVAPMPGVVIDVRCRAGDEVTAGQTLIVLEAMKMEHHMNAPADGRVAEVMVVIGQQVENGAVLVVFEESADNGENA